LLEQQDNCGLLTIKNDMQMHNQKIAEVGTQADDGESHVFKAGSLEL